MKRLEPDEVLQLSEHHRWRARPGYRIFVVDRGRLRLDYPQDWVWSKDDDSFKFRDREPPDDRCTLALSLWHAEGLAREIPLERLVQGILDGEERTPIEKGQVVEERRGGLELAWAEMKFVDQNERREAVSRLCLAREGGLQVILSLDFWPEDGDWTRPIWDNVLASLELDRPIADPRVGPIEH